MNGNDGNVGMGTGGISILAIFVVLCLTTLAALSLVSAQADKALAERTVQASEAYYTADVQAEERLAELMELATPGTDWAQAAASAGYGVTVDDGTALVSYSVPVDDVKALDVVVTLMLGGDGMPTGELTRDVWAVRVTAEYGEAQPLPLLK